MGQATRFGTALLQGTRPDWSPVDPPGALVEGVPDTWWTGLVIPAEAIEFAHAVIDPVPAEHVRNGRVFAAARPAPAGATDSAAFLARTGRDPAWPTSA